MAELTKEYFDEQLQAQTKELKAFAIEQTDEVARIISTAAIEDRQFLESKLDVRQRVESLEKGLEEIRGALHLSMS